MVNSNQDGSGWKAVIIKNKIKKIFKLKKKERGGIVVSLLQTCFRVGVRIGRDQDSMENLQVSFFPSFILGSQKAGVGDMEL